VPGVEARERETVGAQKVPVQEWGAAFFTSFAAAMALFLSSIPRIIVGLIGAAALALGLAFGLGGRDTAGQIVRDWYATAERAAGAMASALQRSP
jgi:hypothetical protein